ncbi:UDP-glucose dehydrogenase family protein [Marmoricola sp. RAF53]|uniref:UDP-glucose dehydrogenase family protein n=1 Tax=Marmoricola sp. RAF53 TaxID=3233059 RepID=UPI003F9CE9D7
MSTHRPVLSVIGTGYLGATHAAGLAELGFEVIGLDRDPSRIDSLSRGIVPFHEPGLAEMLQGHVASGRLRFTTEVADVAHAQVHFVCVGTPQGADGSADLSQVIGAVEALVPLLRLDSLVVGKSTVPVGTAAALRSRIEEISAPGVTVELAWNPEFLREGHAVEDTLAPNRIVLGVPGPRAEALLREVYAEAIAAGVPVVVTDLPTAELIKQAANSFLATKISFVNAMAEVCEASGADVTALADALGHDERIGRRFLDSGLGFGGGCLPKDLRALVARAEQLGCGKSVAFLRDVDAINLRRRDRVLAMAQREVGAFDGVRIAVLGASFKPGSDDVRDSPAVDVMNRLRRAGARVTAYDPAAVLTGRAAAPGVRFAANPLVACRKADLVLHLTEWPEFRALDPEEVGQAVRRRVLIDARNALDVDAWTAAGWAVRAPGRHLAAPARAGSLV